MIQQGTPEWKALRCGKVTASRVADVVARTRTGYGASRANYMAELIAERLTGKPAEGYTNTAMAWGTEKEPEAIAEYEHQHNQKVERIAFVPHPRIDSAGASPDGLVGECGLIEVKCPNTSTHIDTLLSETIADKYVKQMQWQMACTGRSFCDFVSYDPRMPEEMQLHVQRVHRDNAVITSLEKEVDEFLDELALKVSRLTTKYKLAG